MIAIVDYGMGNLRSVQKAFEYLGIEARITDDKQMMDDASHIVLPGVGAIADAMHRLTTSGLDTAVQKQVRKGKPFLGICLGMQLMLDVSYENGKYPCLGLIGGQVRPFEATKGMKIPHMGWNSLVSMYGPLFEGLPNNPFVYFVHSYHAASVASENIAAVCDYGYEFTCGIVKDNLHGLQFHPEKSGRDGLKILSNFGGLR